MQHQFVFPAVFIKEEDMSYTVMIPDLGIVTYGPSIEEAYLFVKDYLEVFCKYAVKLEEDILFPTKFEKIADNNKNNVVMLIDATVTSSQA